MRFGIAANGLSEHMPYPDYTTAIWLLEEPWINSQRHKRR